MKGRKKSIICFGEVLWDIFTTHKVVGGAPMNVVFHANNFGLKSQMISAIGLDDLGKELKEFLKQNRISTDFIHTNYTYPTGTVQVGLNDKGSASYDIVKPVAWDFLYHDEAMVNTVAESDLLLFGSLICRTENNFKTLLKLIQKAQKVVFDVNLRQPFYQQSIIEKLLHKANIVKMNDEELEEIYKWYDKKQGVKEQMTFIKDKFNIETLVVTAGKQGAYCLHDILMYSQKGFPIKVEDTVGSGDSFLAAFIFKMLNGVSWQECLEFACATGALVATKPGGTNVIEENTIIEFIQKKKQIN